jgi:hypothetical protein
VFFLELLPALPRDTIYGLHDIYLPFDYPTTWYDRYYNEQYLLETYILGGADGDSIIFPAAHVWTDAKLRDLLSPLLNNPYFAASERHGESFWMRRSSAVSSNENSL